MFDARIEARRMNRQMRWLTAVISLFRNWTRVPPKQTGIFCATYE